MNDYSINGKNSFIKPVLPVYLNSDDNGKHFHEMLGRREWYEPDVVFLKLLKLWKNKFNSTGHCRRFLEKGKRSFSIINGRLHGVILVIDNDGMNVLLSMVLKRNNIYHSVLFNREKEIATRLNQIFPHDNILFSVKYETK